MTGIVTPKRRGLAWSGPPHLAFQEGYALSTPKPYLGFGLKVRLTLPAASDAPRGAHALSSELLDALQLRHRFHPYPALDITEFVYPCLVVQVKADYSSLYQAENQVATAAAKALVMLEELRETSSSTDQAQRAPNESVLAIAINGEFWEFLLAFRRTTADATNGIVRSPSIAFH